MRIAYVITRADAVGGASIHVRDLASAMQQRGHEVIVLVGGTGPVTEQLSAAEVPYVCLRHLQRSIRPWRDLLAVLELTRVLRASRPDIVSAHTAKAGLIGRAACRLLRIPCIYTPHGWAIGERISPVAGRLFTWIERMAARWSAAIVCVCEYEKRLALEKRIGPADLFHVIHNGMVDVAPGLFAAPLAEPPRICCVARFEAPKDHHTLLRALAGLKHLNWRLDLIGDGPLQEEIASLVGTLGLKERVRFLGYLPDPALALAQTQIFVLSSRSEAFPRSILEAMRAGLPVIATDVGGVTEAVVNHCNGVVVPPSDTNALQHALQIMIENPSLRQQYGDEGRRSFRSWFQAGTMAEATAALYSAVVGELGKWQVE